MSDKKISVIVPIYKVEKYLRRCIESILNQTYTNLEIILVDDGSPDKCGEICDEYAKRDSRIIVVHKENGGLSDARNFGMTYSTGELIAYVDSDDWVEASLYEDTLTIMEEHNADIVLFGSYSTDGNNISTQYKSGNIIDYSSTQAIKVLCEGRMVQSHAWDKLYKREVLEGIEFPKGKLYEDVYVMHEIFKRAKKITFVDRPYYYYLTRGDSIVSQRVLQSFFDLIEGLEKRFSELQDYDDETQNNVRFWLIRSVIDAYRIMSSDGIEYTTEKLNKLGIIINTYDSDNTQYKKLSRNMKIDYLIIKNMKSLYLPYRKLVNIQRNIKPAKALKKCYRKLRKNIRNIKDALTPLKHEVLKMETITPKIVLVGGAEYDNLGDHAISFATKKYIETTFADIPYFEITENEFENHINAIKKLINTEDIILLQGGGNLGNVYPDQQRIRRKIVDAFPYNKMILMPQTCYFADTSTKETDIQSVRSVFEKNPQMRMFAREKYSYEYLQNNFLKTKSFLAPDIVLSLKLDLENKERKGVCLCIRSDKESSMGKAEKDHIYKVCEKKFGVIEKADTCVDYMITRETRENELMNFWGKLSGYELMVTDRLHGLIFAAITNTPCIAFSNNNHKVRGIYNWIENYPWIVYSDNVYDIENLVEKMSKSESDIDLEKEYTPLRNVLEEFLR